MISKAVLCHILVIWGLAQVTVQANRPGIPSSVRSSMIANGWRPLTAYEGKNNAHHSSNQNIGVSQNERHSGPHPVHGKLHEHMATSEKLISKHNKQNHDYNPPSILGSFSAFAHSVSKIRPEAQKSHQQQSASETREFSFLVPPPRDPVRYDIDPYRKVILRDNDAYLRQPQQYIISHQSGPGDIRNSQYYPKGGSGGVAVAASTHAQTTSKNRPVITEYNVQQPIRQQQQQQHVPFESLKISNAKLYLQPPSANGPLNFAHEQQATDNLYERYPSSLPPHAQQLTQEGNNFYSHVNHPSPSFKSPALERDPSFLIHESHEISYATPAPPGGLGTYGNFRPSSPYESLHPPERYSTQRPTSVQPEKFVPSKKDNTRQQQQQQQQQQQNYGQYNQNSGNPNLDNNIVSSEPNYSNGIANTYYISGQQSLTPPAPTWSLPVKTKVTVDINEVLPKANRPAKFNEPAKVEPIRQNVAQNLHEFLFPHSEIQQQHYPSNPLALINQQQPESIYESPESISLKHFNEQQYRLQQQLLQRDRDRLREQELQRQQIELERIAAVREREKVTTAISRPSQETPRPTVEYIDTTLTYIDQNSREEDIRKVPVQQQYIPQEYQEVPFESVRPDIQTGPTYEAENVSVIPDVFGKVTLQPEKTNYEPSEPAPSGHRNRPRKPTTVRPQEPQQPQQPQQQPRRRKPTTTPAYEDYNYHQEEQHHLATLAPNPIVQSPGSLYSYSSTTEPSTTTIQTTTFPSTTTTRTTTMTTTTTQRPKTRRPTVVNPSAGRRRRPMTTTTEEPETTIPPVTYRQEEFTRYEKTETESSRRRRIKPSSVVTHQMHYEVEPTTSTEKKRYEIKNYGNKLGAKEEDYSTNIPVETYSPEAEQVSPQLSYGYTNEQDALYYTPSYDTQLTTGQEPTVYETPNYPTSSTSHLTQESPTEAVDNIEIDKYVHTNIPLEELFVNTERPTTTTTAPITTTTTTTTTTPRPVTAAPTRNSQSRTTGTPVTTVETAHATRPSTHRMRPMRFGNSTRPRFSIKDYKSRLDYRNKMSTTSEAPSVVTSRQKIGTKIAYDAENQTVDSTTGRYRHMSRVSYRITSTTPSYGRRGESGSSTTERVNKFTPKRRLHNNHLYRSKISTSSTTTAEPSAQDDDVTTSTNTRHNSVRNENVFSASIRRRPTMKHAVFTQSSDLRTTRRDPTEMVPEETSFYSPAITQLLTGPSKNFETTQNDGENDHVIVVSEENDGISPTTSQTEISSSGNDESPRPIRVVEQDSNVFEYSSETTASPSEQPGQTEALVKTDSPVTVNSQLEEDLFARASQSVADLTSSASALYDKPGMFKAVSVAPSSAEGGAALSSRFRINQEKPTLPIEAFFHELSNRN